MYLQLRGKQYRSLYIEKNHTNKMKMKKKLLNLI